MTKTVKGIIHGRTIEIDEDLGLSDGQQIEIQVIVPQANEKWGEGLKRCAGALKDDPEWDVIMEEIHQARKLTRVPGEGLLRTEGALANDNEWDALMEEVHQARKVERRSQIDDLTDP